MGSTVEDAGLKALMQPYHDATVAYINTPIGTATAAFPGGFAARIQDGPMADLINQVQTDAAAAAGFPVEASLAALFTNEAKLNAGPIKLKDAYAVYIYDNTLYVIEATGQMIKDELEWTANYFNQYYYDPAGVTVNSAVRDYNYDLWSGIEYKLDVTKPVGQRVVELKLNGEPLAMDQLVRVALNNYRATGKFPDRHQALPIHRRGARAHHQLDHGARHHLPKRRLRAELDAAAAGQHLAKHDHCQPRNPLRLRRPALDGFRRKPG